MRKNLFVTLARKRGHFGYFGEKGQALQDPPGFEDLSGAK